MKKFGRHKAGYLSEVTEYIKPKNGDLIYEKGTYHEVVKHNMPFALLQSIKSTMVKNGYNPKYLKIRYTI